MRIVSAVIAATLLTAAAGSIPQDADTYLRQVGFTAADLQTLASGQVIARVDSGDAGEIVAVAGVKVRTPRAQTTAYYGQMVAYVDGKVTLGFGRFSNPPVLDDVKELTLDKDEVAALRSCKPGDCDLRIGGVGITTIRNAVDWKAPDAAERVQVAVRQAAVQYVSAYLQRGDEALVTYSDTSTPVSLKEQWRALILNSAHFQQYAPALREYLLNYPKATLSGGRDVIYWIKENYGLKPTITFVHTVIYDAPDRPDRTMVVQKQIFASHYYDASVAQATLLDAVEDGRKITYLVYANRSRGDMLKGGFGGIKRKVARDQARQAAIDTLSTIQAQLEKAAGVR